MAFQRVIAVTGASAGIGRAIAEQFVKAGAAVTICARRGDKLAAAAAQIDPSGGRVLAIPADVTSPEAMDDFVARAVSRFGRLDAMVCNAGFGIYGTIDAVGPAQMRRLLDVNFMGTYHAIRAALPTFRRQQSGHLFLISSIVGQRGIPFMGAYAATKFAQAGLGESLRAELRGSGIHLTTVYPISTATEFFSVMVQESGFATRAQGPRQQADVVAAAVVRACGRPVPEIYPYRPSKLLAVLNAIAPGICDQLVKRWGREPLTTTTTTPGTPAGH